MSAAPPPPGTIQEARALGAVPGTILSAPLAPAQGPIAGAPESLVVVTVKKFWTSPTVRAARSIVLVSAGVFLMYVCGEVVAAQGVTGVAWHRVGVAGLNLATVTLAASILARVRGTDNNAIK